MRRTGDEEAYSARRKDTDQPECADQHGGQLLGVVRQAVGLRWAARRIAVRGQLRASQRRAMGQDRCSSAAAERFPTSCCPLNRWARAASDNLNIVGPAPGASFRLGARAAAWSARHQRLQRVELRARSPGAPTGPGLSSAGRPQSSRRGSPRSGCRTTSRDGGSLAFQSCESYDMAWKRPAVRWAAGQGSGFAPVEVTV